MEYSFGKMARVPPSPDNACRRVVIFDAVVRGHHSAYIRWIADGAKARGHSVLIVASNDLKSTPHFADGPGYPVEPLPELSQHEALGLNSLVASQLSVWRAFNGKARQLLAPLSDFVIAPYFDSFSYLTAILGSPFQSTPWTAISMRAPTSESGTGLQSRLKRSLFARSLRRSCPPTPLFLIDRIAAQEWQSRPGFTKRVAYLADPVDQHAAVPVSDARRQLNIPDSAKVILVYGAITRRKGIRLLLQLLAADVLPESAHILVVGRHDESVRSLLKDFFTVHSALRERISDIDRYVSLEEEALAFSAADIAWLVYEDHHGMSGVLVQATNYRLPAIVNGHGLMGWYAREAGIALCVGEKDVEMAAAAAIRRLVDDPELGPTLVARARQQFAANTVPNFQQAIFDGIQACDARSSA